jgi:UDP-3-O-[3-hydroxymyristoyl] glucosamine N-acyltransferase
MNDVPAGQRWFGTPAQTAREHFRDIATLRRLSRREKPVSGSEKA